MPTSLFQYEMLPTTWFYLSSLLILAVFFRFNRFFCIRNFDVAILISLAPGLIYVAMGAALQGYFWLWAVGAILFWRLTCDVFLRRRPLLEANLNYAAVAFSCVAASAFMIPNLFLNRGDACESPRAWRLEQILAAAEESSSSPHNLDAWPGYRPFLRASRRRATLDRGAYRRASDVVDFFGLSLRVKESDREKTRPAARVALWASGATSEYVYDFGVGAGEEYLNDLSESRRNRVASGITSGSADPVDDFGGVQPARAIPTAQAAPLVESARNAEDGLPSNAGAQNVSLNSSRPRVVAQRGDVARANTGGDDASRLSEFDAVGFRWRPLSFDGLVRVLFIVALQISLFVVIVLIGKFHFDSFQTGCSACLLYLLLPYVNQFSARLDHIAPGLMILLAVLLYRRPLLSGVALGAAGSLVFYPFFLFPLWIGYYWKKGLARFLIGSSATVLTFAVMLLFLIDPDESYANALAAMFGRHAFFLAQADGLWEYVSRFYRIPLIALFIAICFGYAIWLPRKNLAALISCSAAVMLAVQSWMGRQGGLYMAWYLPLIALTVFRPNLSDRVASVSVVDV